MSFHQCIHSQIFCQLPVFPKFLSIQDGTDQKHCRCAECFCLKDHILIHRKVFPENRDIHHFRDLTKIRVTSHEIKRFRKAGDRRCTCCLVFFRNFQIWKICCDQSLGRGSFFYFADVGHARFFQSFQKRRLLRRFFCQGFQLFQRKLKFFSPDTFSCFFCDFFQNVFFTHSLFVSSINSSSFAAAAPLSIRFSAIFTPASRLSAFPAI